MLSGCAWRAQSAKRFSDPLKRATQTPWPTGAPRAPPRPRAAGEHPESKQGGFAARSATTPRVSRAATRFDVT